ncbi:acyltransferase family protein [Luteococcus sp. H138]|uniref:acyltransferase family protein n=1 Tax=unclassified Luteococcus TaxID=2639923 RepID=UPI00313C165E
MTLHQPAEAPSPAGTRIHGLDAVRGGALLLGIVIHALMPYVKGMPWLVPDSQTAVWPFTIISGIHFFRMTLFLLMAGYFGHMMRERRGTRGYLKDRLKRITLPLFVFWPIAVLPLGLLAAWHAQRAGLPLERPDVSGASKFDLGHLWFLWVLTQCILLALAVRWAFTRISPRASAATARRLARWLSAPGGVLLAALPYAITTNLQRDLSGIVAPTTLLPGPVPLIAYLGALGVGWLLSCDADSLQRLARLAWWNTALASTTMFGALMGTHVLPIDPNLPDWLSLTLMALAGWSTCYALLGLAVRHLTTERPWVRYLADASYWMYLMHLVLLTFFQVLLAPLDWPILVKVGLNIGATTVILLATYHLFVRSTALGGWLNGRRAQPHTPTAQAAQASRRPFDRTDHPGAV